MRYALLGLVLATVVSAGCTARLAVGEPPKRASYMQWGMRMARIPEIINAGTYCQAGLVHHRNANKLDRREDIVEELNMAIALFGQSADELYLAWERHPEYKKFILLELDKVYGYIHACVARRPYYFDPTDPLNIYGGALTYEQRQRMHHYRQKLEKWEQASGE
jgi:hypothetical protein